MNRAEKSSSLQSIKMLLEGNNTIFLVGYSGMAEEYLFTFRRQLESVGAGVRVVKNTIFKRAVEDCSMLDLLPFVSGQVAVVYSNDPFAISKIVLDSIKKVESLTMKVAMCEGSLLEDSSISRMARVGSVTNLRASLLGIFGLTCSKFLALVSAFIRKDGAE